MPDPDKLAGQILSSPAFTAFAIGLIGGFVGWVALKVRRAADWLATQIGTVIEGVIGRKLTAQELDILLSVARTAVLAAEQLGLAQAGAEKKAKAIEIATTFLAARGLHVTPEQLDAAIEAAVYESLTVRKPVAA